MNEEIRGLSADILITDELDLGESVIASLQQDFENIILMSHRMEQPDSPLIQAVIKAQELGTGIVIVDNEGSCTPVDYADMLDTIDAPQEKETDILSEIQVELVPEPAQEEYFNYQTPAQRCNYSTKAK